MNLTHGLGVVTLAGVIMITATGCSAVAGSPADTSSAALRVTPTTKQPTLIAPTAAAKSTSAPVSSATRRSAKAALTQAAAAASAAAEAVARDEAAATSNPEGDPAS